MRALRRVAMLGLVALSGLAIGGTVLAQDKVYTRAPTTKLGNTAKNAKVGNPPTRGGVSIQQGGGYRTSGFAGGTRAVGNPNGGYRGGGFQGGGYRGGGYRGGGFGGVGWGAAVPGVLMAIPQYSGPQPGDVFVDDGTIDDGTRGRGPQRSSNNRASGLPPAGERRMVPDEVVIEVSNSASPQTIDALQRRFNLQRLEQQTFPLTGTTFYRWRIPDRRSVTTVVRSLEGAGVRSQPNYLFVLQDDTIKAEGDPAQYELAKLHLPEAHKVASGDRVLVAVIDSAIDTAHPDIAGAIADSYDALSTPATPHKHGTGIAGLIAAHGKLMGAAPRAQLLAVRAFEPKDTGAEGTTFNIMKGIDWAVAHGARVINMSFAGPADPAIHRSLEAAYKKGIVLVAAAGNAGAKSPPLYPAAEPSVIAVSATNADDTIFEPSNRGRHIAIAAPGAQLLVAIPDGGYELDSGTSFSAAEISGIVALMIERRSDLTPAKVRMLLQATARDLGPKGPDVMFGAGLADAYAAVMADPAPALATTPRPIERVSTGGR